MTAHQRLNKDEARQHVYRRLREAKAARFPFPIEGRIPNFAGAEAAAQKLAGLAVYKEASVVKVNPDAPQLPVRAMVLRDGKTLIMPSPRLRGGFIRIDPQRVPPGEERRAASLSRCHEYGRPIELHELAGLKIDLIVSGSVAVAPDGARAGKGEGYADLEYAILRELGLPAVPVVTTVHPVQVVPSLQVESHDVSVDYIITPDGVIQTATPHPKPAGIAWNRLSPDDFAAMPVHEDLRKLRWQALTTPDVLAPDLRLLFVGINPGRKSAEVGHNFAGPGNHFWRLLYDAGLTPRLIRPHEEFELLEYGIGMTNIVRRASRGESDLTWDELLRGAGSLRETVQTYRPKVVAFLGKNVYRAYAGLRRSAPVEWGLQSPVSRDHPTTGALEYVAPNPSSRSTIPYEQRLLMFRELHRLAAETSE